MKKIFILIILMIYSFVSAFGHYDDAQSKSKQLLKVKKTIKEKEQEKEKFILQERIFKKELEVLNKNIELTEKKLEKCSSDIKIAQQNLDKSSRIYNDAFSKSSNWNKIILDEIKRFNKMTFSVSYSQNPLEYKIRQKSLEHKKNNFDQAKKTATVSAMEIKKWEKSKKDLLNLQENENKLIARHRDMLKEKNKLLNTTSGRRLVAEQEIRVLNDSAKAMQLLINKINAINKRKQATVVRWSQKSIVKRKKSLLWPVDGKIIVNFGKTKHLELNTYVISNGIKIKAADFSRVKSIDSGIVVFTGEFRSYGKIVIIDHKNSTFSVYGLLDKIFVKEDQQVLKNTVIALLGSGKHSVLYFEIRQNNIPDNPHLWLI
ncbi:MAG: peptidoglycan DD-metalloendopeptidase family protein [Endomicrobium sp.]|uniref:murein hydrolase activator EnvC family protein n=1 Tax=Candidatus Endomicrobiellum pyrsonymphae TaxID=1408203 RepID=UPI00357A0B1A|nr:peptidoglycan DD-metalloendopeptidase family protein [Endomicrobium sp.]